MKNMDWDDLRFFLAVAGAGSLSAAAKQLRVNTTTVLRRIAHLEEALDTRLFERLRSGYQLTQSGVRYAICWIGGSKPLGLRARLSGRRAGQWRLSKAVGKRSVKQRSSGNWLAAFHRQHTAVMLTVLSDQFIGWGGSSAGAALLNPLRDGYDHSRCAPDQMAIC